MLKQIIIGQFAKVVESLIDQKEQEHDTKVQLFLYEKESDIFIDVLGNYKRIETLPISDIKIPMVSVSTVEDKILDSIINLNQKYTINNVHVLLMIKDDKLMSFTYTDGNCIEKIEIENLI
jgi:hypothetical protein